MAVAFIVALAILASKRVHSAVVPNVHANSRCVELTLPVPVTAQNAIYDVLRVDNTVEAAAATLDLLVPSQRNVTDRVISNVTINDTFNIAARLCVPNNGSKKDYLQIATHGGGYDSRYWDIRSNPSQYSYVENALDAGYSILIWDRLGTGKSDKPDAYKVVQLPVQLELLRGITKMAKAGDLMKYANSGDKSISTQKFSKIIQVGHSMGSEILLGLLTHYGELADGAVSTGWIPYGPDFVANSPIAAFNLEYAAENDPKEFAEYGSGYTVIGDPAAVQVGFLSTLRNDSAGLGGFELKLLDYGSAIKSPVTTAELISGAGLGVGLSPDFTGPIQFMLGEFDFLICNGDCRGVPNYDILNEMYPHASNISVHIQEGTGHGLVFHRGAKAGFQVTFEWLHANGL